jgi:hypothetical protein
MAVTRRMGNLTAAGPAVSSAAALRRRTGAGSSRVDRFAAFELPAEGPQSIVEP